MCPAEFFEFFEKVKKRAAATPAGAAVDRLPPTAEPLTVTQLTDLIGNALRDCLPASVLVKGEVSNFRRHGSGHLYFTLKDASSCIDCVVFRSDAARVKFAPQDGMELLATGRVGVYGQRGRYQLYVMRLEPLGQGALELAFRQLCAKLEAEGLFSPQRKKPLPPFPQRVALVTSLHTAALQDMLKVLARFPWVRILVYHVPVQGDGAAERIAEALNDLNRNAAKLGGVDLILLGRGGGSLEDLWEFNEEIVARAVVASGIPIVTGIGHEIDVSIADLVADYHAHTPTEAAQVAMARWRTARETVDAAGIRLRREVRHLVSDLRQRLTNLQRHEAFRRPLDRINALRQLLDDRGRSMDLGVSNRLRRLQVQLHQLSRRLDACRPAALARLRELLARREQRLTAAVGMALRKRRDKLTALAGRLREHHPRHSIELARQRLTGLEGQLRRAAARHVEQRWRRLEGLAGKLDALSPQQVLKRGYTVTRLKKGGKLLRSVKAVAPGDHLTTQFADGTVESTAEDGRQLSLFE